MAALAPSTPPPTSSRDQLILRYFPLVRYAVGSLARSRACNLDAEDILGYGTMGLIDAVDRFDASRGVKFETYAVTRIRGYLLDQLRAHDWLPRTARGHVHTVQRVSEELESRLGRHPSRDELASETGLPPETCGQAMVDAGNRLLSLETALTAGADGDTPSLVDRLEDKHDIGPALQAMRAELRDAVTLALYDLPERQRTVVGLRYGEERTFKEIADILNVSESRACQLHTQALNRMRRSLTAAGYDGERLSA
ncbi:MAG: FliA/WhiG family RNA polymerase sigma factor [Chloroflexota bacterium]